MKKNFAKPNNRIICFTSLLLLILLVGCKSETINKQRDLEKEAIEGDYTILLGEKLGLPQDKLIPSMSLIEGAAFEFIPYGDFSGDRVHGATRPITDLIKNEQKADLIIFDSRMLPLLIEYDFLVPLNPYTDQSLFDLTPFSPDVIGRIEEATPSGEMFALPYAQNRYALFYNRDLFDGFNIPYPTDGMTWDEVIELAKQFDGTNYLGLDISSHDQLASQLNVQLYDEMAQKFIMDSPELEQMYTLLLKAPPPYINGQIPHPGFEEFNRGETAMIAGGLYDHGISGGGFKYSSGYLKGLSMGNDFKWDVVTYPVIDDQNPIAPASVTFLIGIPQTSDNKEKASRILLRLLSQEVQFQNVRNGFASLLEGDHKKEFGKDQSIFMGIHTDAFFPEYREGRYQKMFDTRNIFLESEIYLTDKNSNSRSELMNMIKDAIIQAANDHLTTLATFK